VYAKVLTQTKSNKTKERDREDNTDIPRKGGISNSTALSLTSHKQLKLFTKWAKLNKSNSSQVNF